MYYEEKRISGKLVYRTKPDGKWHRKEYTCANCERKTKDPITVMHLGMHRYVCSGECMSEYYR